MEPQEKKKRGLWTESQLKAAVQAVRSRGMSQRKAAAVYSIPRRTLRNHLISGSTEKITGRLPTLSKEQEKDLIKRIVRLAQVGLPLTPKLVRKQAYEFCKTNKIPNCFNDKKNTAGKKWLKGFIKRNPEISVRKAQFMNPARAQKLNRAIVAKHFEAVKRIYDDLDISNHPERLYNIDEKGCRLTLHHQQKVLAEKGTKRVHFVNQEHAENVTIAMCVNATGNSVPPMILFKGKRLKPEYCDNLPSGSLVKMAPKGSMTTELFVDFINHLGKYKSPGTCLLIFDGASSHLDARIVDEADKNNIVLYCLPSNTTHELQPLDKSVNKSYEHYWDEEVLLYAYQHPDRKITKSRFGKIFTKVWSKCMTQGNIINGFRSTGLFPYDPTAIPDEAYAPSVLTEIPEPQIQNIPRNHDSSFTTPPSRDNDVAFDNDSTDCEDNLQNVSPSVLDELVVNDMVLEPTTPYNTQSSMGVASKLVDYSSSAESVPEIDSNVEDQLCSTPFKMINRNSEFQSPIPSTSGINKTQFRPQLNYDSFSDSSLSDDIDTVLQRYFQRPARNNKIYSSSSEAEEQDVSEMKDTQEHEQNSFNDSDDNLPLIKIKESSGDSVANKKTPFHKQIPTPNFAVIKSTPRRKALNNIGQKITKDLFDTAKDKKNRYNDNKGRKKANSKKGKYIKGVNKKTKTKTKVINSEPKKTKEVGKKDKRQQAKHKISKNAVHKNTNDRRSKNEAWYCLACNVERLEDMRRCEECQVWYHEDCVGLTKEDLEPFVCPKCN